MSSLVSALLRQQQQITAVDRFSNWHDQSHGRDEERYSESFPSLELKPGQQLAFEVDMDACTGCKSCVTACHQMNDLDPGEVWRNVGRLHGGTAAAPVQLTVTASCHHCLDPACMRGCPVGAYKKDAITGIVEHLDDVCIGCQYCTLTCPYDVPVFNADRGIVRKCDMCASRLSAGEDTACVQGCPNDAISIRPVDVAQVLEECEAGSLVPGAPAAHHTYSTTRYVSKKPMPRNLLPADYYTVRPQHSHPSLVVFLALSQLAVGVFFLAAVLSVSPLALCIGAAAGVLGVGASLFHLGRPMYAYRVMAGLRTSWLSREALAFGAFAGLVVAGTGLTLVAPGYRLIGPTIITAASLGVVGLVCSALLYAATERPLWRAPATIVRFCATAVALGGAAIGVSTSAPGVVFLLIPAAVFVELVADVSVLLHLRDRHNSPLRRSASLIAGPLRTWAQVRVLLAVIGGIVLPLTVGAPAAPVTLAGLLVVALISRHLFFVAVSAPRMPGRATA